MLKQLSFLFLVFAIHFAHASDKPNILLILSDDQAWTDYSFMNHEAIKTPNIDKLAKEGILFKRGYVPTALCRPSLMALITGHYANTHGVTGNDPTTKNMDKSSEKYSQQRAQLISKIDRFETLPKLLAEQGYLSHQSGKWWEGNYKRGGFTHGMTKGYPSRGGRHGDAGLAIGRKGLKACTDFIDHAVEQDKPFFMWYAPFLPHTPHTPPERILKKYQNNERPLAVAKYYAMCEWFDEINGELLDYFEQKKIRDNTLVIYISDNGWIQSEKLNRYAPRSKQTAYEGGIRQPIIFNWPEKLKAQQRDELITSLDIFPTILTIAGARLPNKKVPGINLLPYLEQNKEIPRKKIFGESFAHDIADLKNPEASLLYRWCIQDQWKLLLTYDGEVNRYNSTHPRDEKRPQLFDLIKDPHETKNLALENPQILSRMVKEINQWYPVKNRKVITKFIEN